jgi:hypothetical protein
LWSGKARHPEETTRATHQNTVSVDGPRSVPSGPNRMHTNPTHPPRTRSTPPPPPNRQMGKRE